MLWRMFGVVFFFSLVGFINFAQAQINKEVEPNNTCATAQDFSKVGLPFKLVGQNGEVRNPDADYYKLTGKPGDLVEIYVQAEFSTYASASNSHCSNLSNPGGGYVVLKVPKNGIFIVDASGRADYYTVSVNAISRIGSVVGQVFDSITKRPLIATDHTRVKLYRCKNKQCESLAGEKGVDEQGKFSFSEKTDGFALGVGRYKLVVSGDQYQVGQSQEFTVVKDQAKQMNVAMESYPARISVVPCDNIPNIGGECKFSVTVKNPQTKRLVAKLWNLVEANNINHLEQTTRFTLGSPKVIGLPKGGQQTLDFSFAIPQEVRNGAQIFITTYVGGTGKDMGFDIKTFSHFGIVKKANKAALQIMSDSELAGYKQH